MVLVVGYSGIKSYFYISKATPTLCYPWLIEGRVMGLVLLSSIDKNGLIAPGEEARYFCVSVTLM